METVVEVNPTFDESPALIINGGDDSLMEDRQQQGGVKEEILDDDTISAEPEVTRDKQQPFIIVFIFKYGSWNKKVRV